MKAKLLERLNRFEFFDAFKHISVLFLSIVLIQLLSIVSLRAYTYFLNTEEYGITTTAISYISILTSLLTFGVHSAYSRYYFEEHYTDTSQFLGSTLFFTTFIFSILAPILWLSRYPIGQYLNLPPQLLAWMLITTYTILLGNIMQQHLIASKQTKKSAIYQTLLQYAKFGISVSVLWLAIYPPALGRIFSEALACILFVFYPLYVLWPISRFKPSLKHLTYMIQIGFPLTLFSISSVLLTSFDQWYINAKLSSSDAGYYNFAYKISMIITGLISASIQGASTDFYTWMNEGNKKNINKQVISITKLITLVSIFFILFAGDLGSFLDSKGQLSKSLIIAPVIIVSIYFSGLAQLFNRHLLFAKLNHILVIQIIAVSLLNILLNIYFIGYLRYGYQIAAYTTLVSYITLFIINYLTNYYLLKIDWLPIKRILIYALCLSSVSVIYLISFYQQPFLIWWHILIKIILMSLITYYIYGNQLSKFLGRAK
jgi:O-antigen/teichoic acid export membrane protein